MLHFLIASDTGTQAVPNLKQFQNISYFRSMKDILETIGTFTYLHKIIGYMDIREFFSRTENKYFNKQHVWELLDASTCTCMLYLENVFFFKEISSACTKYKSI